MACEKRTSSVTSSSASDSNSIVSTTIEADTTKEEESTSLSEIKEASSVTIPDGYIGIYLHTNYGDTDVIYDILTIEKNTKLKKPSFPTRDGYQSQAWYTEASCENEFNFNKIVTTDINLYPKWLKNFTFEAEYTELDGKQGFGYSGGSGGIQMIGKDTYNAGASNGYYVSYLYYNGAFLEWDINADKASTGNILNLRLTAEFYDYTFTDSELKITVNDTELTGYNTIVLNDTYDVSQSNLRPFTTFTISSDVSLNQGENVIKMTVSNSKGHGGTLYSEAPIVDCLYIASEKSELTWDPYTENVEEWESLH